MTDEDVKAEILNLSGMILAGKASREGIGRVTGLAKEHGLMSFLADEFKDIDSTIRVRLPEGIQLK